MSKGGSYDDIHKGEEIVGECPGCRLPIYASDSRRVVNPPATPSAHRYHIPCANRIEGDYYERELMNAVNRLRGCGYVVELTYTRPVR